jgi:hypothetical protein
MDSKEKSHFSWPPYTNTVLAQLKFAKWVQNSLYLVQLLISISSAAPSWHPFSASVLFLSVHIAGHTK